MHEFAYSVPNKCDFLALAHNLIFSVRITPAGEHPKIMPTVQAV